MSKYLELRKINVNEHTEKKGKFTYLSWAWAVDQLLQLDPTATWEYKEPVYFAETLMVFCSVTAFGKTMTAQLPVMNMNKAIPNPDAFQVNTAMQRCLAKAIALHGLGLYIYAGEDIPDEDAPDRVGQARGSEDLSPRIRGLLLRPDRPQRPRRRARPRARRCSSASTTRRRPRWAASTSRNSSRRPSSCRWSRSAMPCRPAPRP